MADIRLVEITIMYNHIREITDPQTALETLSEKMPFWGFDPKQIFDYRLNGYLVWLREQGRNEWADYLKRTVHTFNKVFSGTLCAEDFENGIDEPEGWINPFKYLIPTGGKPDE